MAAKSYLDARLWGAHQRNIKDIDPNLNLVDAVDTDTVAGTYVENDVVLCVETGTCIGTSMVAMSYYKRVSGVWTLLSYTTQSTMSKRTQLFGVDGNPSTPLSNPAPTADAHTARKVDVDGVQTNLTAEASARTNADTTLQTNINGVQTNLNTETDEREIADNFIKSKTTTHPDYTQPSVTLSGLGNITTIEAGINWAYPLEFLFTKNDAPAIAPLTALKFFVDNVEQSKTGWDGNSPFTTESIDFIEEVNRILKITADYDAPGAPEAKLNNYDEADLTNAFAAGTKQATLTVSSKLYRFYNDVAAAPTNSAEVRLGNATFNDTVTFQSGTSNKVWYFAFPATKNLLSWLDKTINGNYTSAVSIVTFNVKKGGGIGADVSYKIAVLTQTVNFSSSHEFEVKIS